MDGMASIDPEIISKAGRDLAERLKLAEADIKPVSVAPADFPDAALGAPVEDEMSAQVITPGWRIRLAARGETYEYRATSRQLRLVDFKGRNYRV
jgi:hypothetical protein